MIRRILLLALLSAPLPAQFVFYLGDKIVGEQTDLGTVAVGDILTTNMLVRNSGSAPANLTVLSVSGARFRLPISLPRKLAAGESLPFQILFEPDLAATYSAVLRADGLSVILRATAVQSLAIYLEGRELSSAAPADFGAVERGGERTLVFVLRNPTAVALTTAVTVAGAAFALRSAPPPALLPGESARLEIAFQPLATGAHQGELSAALRRIPLVGTGSEPPLPAPEVILEAGAPQSAAIARAQVRLKTTSRTSGQGRLEITFRPAPRGPDNDPAILFPAVASRVAQFTVTEGADAGRFGSAEWIEFQTGTTAGTIQVTANLDRNSDQATLEIQPAPVGIDTCKAARLATALELRIAGFDNTRLASAVAFTFYDAQGKPVPPGTFRLDAAAEFSKYFDSSLVGGMFELHAVFPVTGSPAEIAAVETEFTNPAGVSRVRKEF